MLCCCAVPVMQFNICIGARGYQRRGKVAERGGYLSQVYTQDAARARGCARGTCGSAALDRRLRLKLLTEQPVAQGSSLLLL